MGSKRAWGAWVARAAAEEEEDKSNPSEEEEAAADEGEGAEEPLVLVPFDFHIERRKQKAMEVARCTPPKRVANMGRATPGGPLPDRTVADPHNAVAQLRAAEGRARDAELGQEAEAARRLQAEEALRKARGHPEEEATARSQAQGQKHLRWGLDEPKGP